ncbi:hypothetical protein BVY00_02495 [bacterium G20]|nr:hypothetical protein BVY00_02495 [bacterium G20]
MGVASLLLVSYLVFVTNKKPATQIVDKTNGKIALGTPFPKDFNRGLPVRLQIPKIKVDATIVYLGLTTAGDMAVPSNAEDVGWYKYGTLPGNTGSAVIDGHIVGSKGEKGVFIDLKKLEKGDSLIVIDSQGRTASFAVRETHPYAQDQHPSEVFNASNGAHLNLITCAGDWDNTQHRYLERLVVFADKSN